MQHGMWTNEALQWNLVQGTRKQGRPETRWEDPKEALPEAGLSQGGPTPYTHVRALKRRMIYRVNRFVTFAQQGNMSSGAMAFQCERSLRTSEWRRR